MPDPQAFRQALGSFATGVTIITTRGPDGEALGLTVSSFNSVSLSPPLVLWSLAETSWCLPVFREAQHWAVHVLSSAQADLSSLFARSGEDKFAGLDLEDGIAGTPMLRGCTARFQCKTAFQYEGGDHQIFVGEVVEFDRSDAPPLVFHGGRYARATHRDQAETVPRAPYLAGSFNDDFLGYLLGRSHFRFFGQIKPMLEAERLSDEEFYVLSTLTLKQVMSDSQMSAVLSGVLDENSENAIQSLIRRGLAVSSAGDEGLSYTLSADGSACALRLISAAKAVESKAIERLGDEEAVVLKTLLRRLLDTIDPGADALWSE